MKPPVKPVVPFALLLLAGCAVDMSSNRPGPAGPPGPEGPVGRYRVVTAMADTAVDPQTDILIARASIRVMLPSVAAAGAGRAITVRCAGACTALRIEPQSGDRIEGEPATEIEGGEMLTLIVESTGNWTIVSSSDL
jgi:hypothetical protein